MKKLFVFLGISAFVTMNTIAQTAPKTDMTAKKDTPVIVFEKTSIDLGNIPGGVPTNFEFAFTNASNEPLILSNVAPTCGCTIADWPKEPIVKGKKGIIKGTYNGSGSGMITKTMTVHSNSKTPVVSITFKANVVQPAPASAQPAAPAQPAK
jgi:hypothetical protein